MSTTSTGQNDLDIFSNALVAAVERGAKSVVLVNARRRQPASGIVYASDLILTADHILERDEDIQVVLPDDQVAAATIAGRDPARDIALLRLTGANIEVAQPAPDMPRVGQIALALGRPDRSGIQASMGVISAVGGPVRIGRGSVLEQFIRTDTIPYPGFSGGALINAGGQVLGLNTSGLSAGSLITIPVKVAWQAAASLAAHGHIRQGYLGIRSQTVSLSEAQAQALGSDQKTGLLLVGVAPGAPADRAGWMVGDIITGIEGRPVQEHDDLQSHLDSESIGQTLQVQILRGGSQISAPVRVGELA